jgi:phosphatidyl-myo-inositol dimannoside synthase
MAAARVAADLHAAAGALAAAGLTNRFDAVLAGRALPEGIIAWAVGRLRGCKVMIYAHGEELTGWGRGRKFQAMCFALRHADHVLANSDFTRETLISLIGVRPERIVMTYPTVDTDRMRPGLPHDDLRRASACSPRSRWCCRWAGCSGARASTRSSARCRRWCSAGTTCTTPSSASATTGTTSRAWRAEAGVSERVHLLGHVAPDDLPRWYNACNLFAMPNRDINGDTEGFGLVFMEANSCGRPVIAGRAGGTGSAVEHGLNGLRVDGEDVAEVAQGIASLLDDPALARRMGEAGRHRTVERFTSDQRAEIIRQLIVGR